MAGGQRKKGEKWWTGKTCDKGKVNWGRKGETKEKQENMAGGGGKKGKKWGTGKSELRKIDKRETGKHENRGTESKGEMWWEKMRNTEIWEKGSEKRKRGKQKKLKKKKWEGKKKMEIEKMEKNKNVERRIME